MKKDNLKLLVIIVVGLLVYLTFFIKEVEDVSIDKNVRKTEVSSEETKIDTLLNEKGYLVIGKPNNVKLILASDTIKYSDFFRVAQYKNDVIIAKFRDDDNLEVFKKISELPAFESYKVPVYMGKLKDPDFSTNPEAKQFITRIKEGCKSGINFAGHYTLVFWGCGTSCQYGVVVDRKNGNIYNGYQSSLGSEFRIDSKLIIIDADSFNAEANYIPLYQFKKFRQNIWSGKRFEKLN
ncbi:MAG: hypothetical protein JXQ93_05945 [Flavobacteriaceae bacterium]